MHKVIILYPHLLQSYLQLLGIRQPRLISRFMLNFLLYSIAQVQMLGFTISTYLPLMELGVCSSKRLVSTPTVCA